jgi:4-phospho-D-threonate 3-dehydrogenase / 4-phospho-D-erythronate 3-dehydrogenase
MTDKPTIAVVIGDPGGIGPEVICKGLAAGDVYRDVRPVLIGSTEVVESANKISGSGFQVRRVVSLDAGGLDPKVLDVYDTGQFDIANLTYGKASAESGRAQANWLSEADTLCHEGKAAGLLMGTINSEALQLAGAEQQVMDLAEPLPGKSYLLVVTGPLRVVHMIHHFPVREVCDLITQETVLHSLRMTHENFEKWGVPKPRIVVSGWNVHAYGKEDQEEIAPGVAAAQALGIDATGPVSPDTVYRQNIEGLYDVVLAMSHDQGHIAIKTWGFLGNCSVTMGFPYISTSVAHGTAYDIAGKGIARHENMLEALKMTASLATGGGFTEPEQVAA